MLRGKAKNGNAANDSHTKGAGPYDGISTRGTGTLTMPDRLKLLPCPFCGSDKPIVVRSNGYWVALCRGCRASSGKAMTEAQAVKAWNRRTGKAKGD